MSTSMTSQSQAKLNKYGYNTIARNISIPIVSAVLLFAGAGTLDWVNGWLFTMVYFAGFMVLNIMVARANPDVMNERGKRKRDWGNTKTWDWLILSIYGIILLVQPLVAGLDYRNQWAMTDSPLVIGIGLALVITGFIPLTWSLMVNRNFVPTVRIQTERGHQVANTGPYAIVRHPGYVGLILQFVGMSLALGSWVSLLVGGVGVVTYIIRTALEDRTLQSELPGYAEYSEVTRYRLLPGVW